MYNNCQTKSGYKKTVILSLISHFPFKTLKTIGFNISSAQFTSARKHSEKYGAGVVLPKVIQPKSKQKLSENIINKITDYYFSNSNPASNRTIKINKQIFPVYYMNDNKKNLYLNFIDETKCSISFSSFCKYKPKQIKKGKKKTDMCDDCEKGKIAERKLIMKFEDIHKGCNHLINDVMNDEHDNCFDESDKIIVENLREIINHSRTPIKRICNMKHFLDVKII